MIGGLFRFRWTGKIGKALRQVNGSALKGSSRHLPNDELSE